MTSFPGADRHHGEVVVEPGLVDGAVVDLSGAPTFVKTATIRAVQMPTRFWVDTLEGRMVGDVGDWLVQANTEKAERWIIKDDVFQATYVEAPSE